MGFSSRLLVIVPVKLLIGLHFSHFAIAFITRFGVLTNAAVKVVFAVVPRVFAEWETLTCAVSLRDVVTLGGEVVPSRLVCSGFAILITLLLQGKSYKKQCIF